MYACVSELACVIVCVCVCVCVCASGYDQSLRSHNVCDVYCVALLCMMIGEGDRIKEYRPI